MKNKELEIKSCYDYFKVYQMPQGDWGAFCFGYVSDGFESKADALIWVIEKMWQTRHPEQGQIKLPEKNDEKDFPTLEEDSPELNKMMGWNACVDFFKYLNNIKD